MKSSGSDSGSDFINYIYEHIYYLYFWSSNRVAIVGLCFLKTKIHNTLKFLTTDFRQDKTFFVFSVLISLQIGFCNPFFKYF